MNVYSHCVLKVVQCLIFVSKIIRISANKTSLAKDIWEDVKFGSKKHS